MANSVVYNPDTIQVQDPRRDNVVVYAHPGDKINIGLDVSSLRREVVNGDLVIKTLSGGSITIANYSIMFLQDKAPIIVDSLSKEYSYYDFLNASSDVAAITSSSDSPDSVIVSRVVSTPRSISTGDFLASGEEFLQGANYNSRKLVGMIDVDEQHPVLAQDVSLSPYMLLRLYPDGVAQYDAEITYRYNGRTILNQEEPSTLPVVTRTTNPRSEPIYGTKDAYSSPTGTISQSTVVDTIAGGGDSRGNNFSDYMFNPQILDYSTVGGSLLYRAYTGNQIVRGLNLYLIDGNATLSGVTIQDVPNGVVFQSTESTEVQPLGNGQFYITPKSQSQSIDLYFVYNEANARDNFGNPIGLKDVMQQIRVSIEGYNSKYQQLVLGSTEITLDFRQVHGENDVNNFSMYNTYTYSTTFDPLIVSLTHYDDYIIGGVVNHLYNAIDGDDTFLSGTGNETVFLGEGNDTFIYNWGNDTADGKANYDNVNNPQMIDTDVIRFDHAAYVNSTGQYIFNTAIGISFNNGVVNINNRATNPLGIVDNSNSTFKNFDELYLEEDTGVSVNTNNNVTINSTAGFHGFKIYSGGGNDTLTLTRSSFISFDDLDGAFISTETTRTNAGEVRDFDDSQKIYFGIYASGGVKDYFGTIFGSSQNDYFLASDNKNFSVYFDGSGGKDTLDFSALSNEVTFNAITGETTYGNSHDTLIVSNGVFIGTNSSDLIYGSGNGSMEYYGHATTSASSSQDTVTYENWTGSAGDPRGVIIDYITGQQQGYVKVDKYGRGSDYLYYIDIIEASQADDIFRLSYGGTYNLDGLAGKDIIEYSTDPIATSITVMIDENIGVTSSGASGSVVKGANVDTFRNINGITGSRSNDIFIIQGPQFASMTYDGGGGNNDTIDYSNTSGLNLYYLNDVNDKETLTKQTTNGNFIDYITGFSTFLATNLDDVFEYQNDSWQANNNVNYDGVKSTYNSAQDITESGGVLTNAGDVLYLNYNAGIIPLSSIELKFKNFDTLRLGDYNQTIAYADSRFQAIWGSTKAGLVNTFDAVSSSNVVDFQINNNIVSVISLGLKIYNFNVIRGADSGSTFNVAYNGTKANSNYEFVGGQSLLDTLDYGGNIPGAGTPSSIKLIFNLGSASENDPGQVDKGNGNIDKFSYIERFVGGHGDDTFILNPYNTSYQIDGGEGTDTVSFANYFSSVSSANIDTSLFTSIERFELTNFDDSWLIGANMDDSNVGGGIGLDTILIDANITSVSYTVGANVMLAVSSVAGNFNHTLTGFEILYGTDSITQQSATDKVVMNSVDNAGIAEGGNLYFILNNAEIDYSSLTIGLTLDIFGLTTIVSGVDSNMSITKNNAVDYFSGVEKIILGSGDDSIKLDLTAPESFDGVSIDAGGGTNTIDVSEFSTDVILDFSGANPTLNGFSFLVTNWSVLITGDGDDEFKLGSGVSGLTMMAGFGNNTLDLSAFTETLDFTFTENTQNIEIKNSAGNSIVKYTGNTNDTIIAGSGDETFLGISTNNYTIDGGAGNNTISYQNSGDTAGFSFNLGVNSSVVKGSTGNIDTILNMNSVIGTSKDDYFYVDSGATLTSIDGLGGRNELYVDSTGASSGFNFDLDHNTLTGGNISGTISLRNFQVLHGSSLDDTFTLTGDDVLVLQGEIDGAGGTGAGDTLNARITDSTGAAVGLYVNLATGYFYKNDGNNNPVMNEFLYVQGINNINLGDGNDLILFSGSLAAGNYTIDVGGGANFLSFEQINYALVGSGNTAISLDDMITMVTGGASFNIQATGGSLGYKLSNFNDMLAVGSDALLVDGGGGTDTIDYSAITDNITIDYSNLANPNQIIVQRGSISDDLQNFEVFILGSGTNEVIAGLSPINVVFSTSGNDQIISYEDVDGGVVANLDRGTVFKQSNGALDRVANANIFRDSKGNDLVYASSSFKEIEGSFGDDLLNLTRLTATSLTYTNNGSVASISDGSNININLTTANANAAHTYNRMIFGNYNTTIITNNIEGRIYNGSSASDNTLDYRTISGTLGIYIDFARGTVMYNDRVGSAPTPGGVTDTFTNFSIVYGTDNGDNYQGLNGSSTYELNLGSGSDIVSFTGSTSRMEADIDASGTISTGTVNINKGAVGNLTIGATRFNDTFHVKDMAVLSVNRGISGETGVDTLDFNGVNGGGNAGGGIDFTIGDAYNYKFLNFNNYSFTTGDDNITWVYNPNDLSYLPASIDFDSGTDTFLFGADNISGSRITFSQTSGNSNNALSVQNTAYSLSLTLMNLETLSITAGSAVVLDSLRAVFDGYTYTGGDIFGSQIDIGTNITFSNGINFEYRNFDFGGAFDTSTIVADISSLSFVNAKTTRVAVNLSSSSSQNRDVNLRFTNSVDFTTNSAGNAPTTLTLTAANLTAAYSGADSQIFVLNRVADSSLSVTSGSFVVNSAGTINIFSSISVAANVTVDFTGYSGQHGNISTGEDWRFNTNGSSVELTGRFANDFAINFAGAAVAKLTSNNDTLTVTQSYSLFGSGVSFDGDAGINTFNLMGASSNSYLANITNNAIMMINNTSNVAGAATATGNSLGITNFQIFNSSSASVSTNLTNANIINILLDPSSEWTTIIAPSARQFSTTAETMPRNILNGAGYSSAGTTAGLTGGFSTGGNFIVNFVSNTNSSDPSLMNRMMQVQATYGSQLFDVQNIQSIYGRRGASDSVIFAPLDTVSFYDIIDQLAHGRAYQGGFATENGTNALNVEGRKTYLYLDLEFGRDETGSSANNSQTDSTTNPVDTIDFSTWMINDPNNKVYDIALRASRGDGANNTLGFITIGGYLDNGVEAMLNIRMAGNQEILLPQSRIYLGGASNYLASKVWEYVFPRNSDSNYYATYDNYVGNAGANGAWNPLLFMDSDGRTQVKAGQFLTGFTTIYFDNNGAKQNNTVSVASKFSTGGLFQSNKVFLYFDQSGPATVAPTDTARSVNADVTSGNGANDALNFSNIATGNYYFSWGSWQMQDATARVSNYLGWQDESKNTNRQATAEYNNYIKASGTGVGIVFTDLITGSRVGTTQGYDSNLFYRMQGVNSLQLTGGNDTFALGKVFWGPNGTTGPSGAFVNYGTSTTAGKTFLNAVDAGAGMNTLVDNTFSSDNKKSNGSAQSGAGRAVMDAGFSGDRTLSLLGYYNTTSGRPEADFGSSASGRPAEGHIERFYYYDDTGTASKLSLRNLAVIDSTYGTISLQASNSATLANQQTNASGNLNYVSNFASSSYTNFNKLNIDDYGALVNTSRGNYYQGVRDIISVKA
ncbi:MAG: hypothetical protein LBH40_00335, partial [Alphaproteobacteria bacterium]|nr:hypothetical protein [Alphaproteobacteria bacterium]